LYGVNLYRGFESPSLRSIRIREGLMRRQVHQALCVFPARPAPTRTWESADDLDSEIL